MVGSTRLRGASPGVVLAFTAALAWGAETESVPQHCGIAIPSDQAVGVVANPEGDVFCPLLADPKSARSFASYVRGSSTSALGTDLGSVGIGDRYAIVRVGGPGPGEGLQIGLEAGVFAQFDMRSRSYDLVNADYLVGIPLTFRRGWSSGRLRVYHQSSHLGDELLLRANIPRENFSYESVEAILSGDRGPFRVYGGGEKLFAAIPRELASNLVHAGAELRPRPPLLRLSGLGTVRFIAGGDYRAVEILDWQSGWSARAGLEVTSASGALHASRPWSVLAEYHAGPSPYGQFYRSGVTYYGVGLHFDL